MTRHDPASLEELQKIVDDWLQFKEKVERKRLKASSAQLLERKMELLKRHDIHQSLFQSDVNLYYTDTRRFAKAVPYKGFMLIPHAGRFYKLTGKVKEAIISDQVRSDRQSQGQLRMSLRNASGEVIPGEYNAIELIHTKPEAYKRVIDEILAACDLSGYDSSILKRFYCTSEPDSSVKQLLRGVGIDLVLI